MSIPTVVIIGRPNVGKSTLFNRLIGRPDAITSKLPGTTRDRLYAKLEWNGKQFRLVDTAGMFFDPYQEISTDIVDQVLLALTEADLILFVVHAKQGLLPIDEKIAQLLKQKNKPVLLVANQADTAALEQHVYELYALGLGDPIAISALSGRRSGDLLDLITDQLPKKQSKQPSTEQTAIAIVGRPNVGKSTLLNTLLGQKRVSVSAIPGTTRDAIDVELEVDGEQYLLIDTAGIRRRGKIEPTIEKYSVIRALAAIERSQLVLVMIDAVEGITHQDKILLGEVLEQQKAILLVCNKWDLLMQRAKEQAVSAEDYARAFEVQLVNQLKFASWIPFLTLSALTQKRATKIWEEVKKIKQNLNLHIGQSELSKRLMYWKTMAPRPVIKGHELRVISVRQTGSTPPEFTFRVNNPKLVHFSYERFLENQLRADFKITNIPLVLKFKRASFE